LNTKPTILSTKILSRTQKELLLNAGIGCVAYNAIEIELLEGNFNRDIKNAIFTSKNAVRAIQNSGFRIQNCFCVGENTKKLLEENGQKVIEITQNASELGENIAKNYKNEQFHFFCGNLRREELPSILKENNISLIENEHTIIANKPTVENVIVQAVKYFDKRI